MKWLYKVTRYNIIAPHISKIKCEDGIQKYANKIFVINNKGYGLIKQTLETWLNSKYTGVDKKSGLSLPNFISISKAYGIKTFNIKNNLNLKSKLKHIINLKGPVLINVNVDPKKRVKPKIDYGNPLHDMSPKLDQNFIKSIIDI